ncbi:carbohydrate kinase family protein [Polluticaenibacter yanchengensis]|uniref:Carbohydrate kinase n=1 Tax=Polluticaenibacter yanchengensis TaxID=3014562 RepID=A0ABT4UMQ7_9BACT|nr:carbohydrate kinase [Chitinophagaceae bacterium LY-5]
MNAVSFVCFGEILWDILPGEEVPGGAPMNVAYHLQQLGYQPVVITQVGKDKKGYELLEKLHQLSINTAHVLQTGEHQTGIVNAIPQPNGDMKYDIISPVAWDFIECTDALLNEVKQADYFIFGSLAARNHTSGNTLKKLISVARKKILDINLRVPHYTESHLAALLECADILKLNEEELVLITGWWGNFESLESRAAFIAEKFRLELVIVTRGADGAMVYKDSRFYYQEGIPVKVIDTIGSGDSFLAAFIAGYSAGKSIQESLTAATKLGAFVASSKGAWPEYKTSEIFR